MMTMANRLLTGKPKECVYKGKCSTAALSCILTGAMTEPAAKTKKQKCATPAPLKIARRLWTAGQNTHKLTRGRGLLPGPVAVVGGGQVVVNTAFFCSVV